MNFFERLNVEFVVLVFTNAYVTGVFKMPPKRLLSHYKLDAQRDRLVTLSCNAEDMLLPRSNFLFYGNL